MTTVEVYRPNTKKEVKSELLLTKRVLPSILVRSRTDTNGQGHNRRIRRSTYRSDTFCLQQKSRPVTGRYLSELHEGEWFGWFVVDSVRSTKKKVWCLEGNVIGKMSVHLTLPLTPEPSPLL